MMTADNVRVQKAKGYLLQNKDNYDIEFLKKNLFESGYSPEEVDVALSQISGANLPPLPNQNKPLITPKENPNNQETANMPSLTYGINNHDIQKKTNTLAVVGLIASIIIPFIGLIICIISLNEIKKTGERGRDLAIAGIIVSISIMLLLFIIFILGIILAFNMTAPAKKAAVESNIRSELRTIQTAIEYYNNKNIKYPATLSDISEEVNMTAPNIKLNDYTYETTVDSYKICHKATPSEQFCLSNQ